MRIRQVFGTKENAYQCSYNCKQPMRDLSRFTPASGRE